MCNFKLSQMDVKSAFLNGFLNEEAYVMSAYFCPHLMFNSGYLIEFMCLKIDLIEISYNWVS